MKLFVFDVDNTLVSHFKEESYIPKSTKSAIKMIKEAGHMCILATGRAYIHTKEVMNILDIDSAVLCNGTVIVNNNEVISDIRIDLEDLKNILSEVKEFELPTIAFDANNMYFYDTKGTLEEIIKSQLNTIGEDISTMLLEMDFSKSYNVISVFAPHEFNRLVNSDIIPWGNEGVEIISHNMNKAVGINNISQKLGVNKDDIYVFGDNLNDVEMFREFYENSYVLGNAPDSVKQYAKNICKHIDEDGVYTAVVEILSKS